MTPLHEQQRRASAPYFNSRVGVGVGLMPTVDADEARLALAALSINDTAGRAGLRGVRGGDVDQPAPGSFELVLEHGTDLAPRLIEDRSIKAALLGHATAGRVRGPRCACRHGFDVQIFKRDDAKPAGDVGRSLMRPVPADASDPGLDCGHARPLFRIPAGATLASRHDALSPADALVEGSETGKGLMLSRRKAQGVRHSHINACGRKIVRSRSLADICRERHGPALAVAAESDVPKLAEDRACAPKAEPSQLGEAQLAPFRADLVDSHFLGFAPDGVVLAPLPPLRPPAPAREEAGVSSVQVAECLLQTGSGWSGDEVERRSQFGQLTALAGEADRAALSGPVLAPEVPPLLKGQVVHKPRHADPLVQRLGLRRRRMEIEAETSVHGLIISESAVQQHGVAQ